MSKTVAFIVGLIVVVLVVGGIIMVSRSRNRVTTPAIDTLPTDNTDLTAEPTDLATTTSPSTSSSPRISPSAKTSPTASASATTSAEVTYASSGFSPSSKTVKVGTLVTFKNNSSSSLWVASNPHPTHTDLPGFDSLKALKKGESYSFTFSKKGSWGYHNHLDTSMTGTIVVE